MSEIKLSIARQLIKEKRYEDARVMLEDINTPIAREWLTKLDKISPKRHSLNEEKTFYQDMYITITSKRIITNGKTVPISQIAFVESTATIPNLGYLVMALISLGVSLLFFFTIDRTTFNVVLNLIMCSFIPFCVGCYALYEYLRVKKRFYVSIGISSGAIQLLSSKDETYIDEIAEKINQALVNA